MSSSSSASPSLPTSPSTPDDTGNNFGADPGPSTRRTGDFEAPSSSRRRAMYEVWPEDLVEVLATQVAIDAARSGGRLAAAPALANIFQVCPTWRAVSRSRSLWEGLTRGIWCRTHPMRPTWHEEYIHWHRMARNFVTGRYSYTSLHFDPSDVDGDPDTLTCRCLTLSDIHLACGFADGTVRLFELETRDHVSTFRSYQGDRFGPFSRSVSGIVITNTRLVFATLDGDIYVAILNGQNQIRRAREGDVVNSGVLVEFAGCRRWWVGLFAGVPGQAFQIWDAHTEETVFIGGSLTDPETVMGWHMLTELTEPVGRLRVTNRELAVACTTSQLIVFDLRNPGIPLHELWSNAGFIVTSLDVSQASTLDVSQARQASTLDVSQASTLDVSQDTFFIVERNGEAKVHHASTLEQLCEFRLRDASLRGLMGCKNMGFALTCAGGMIRIWDVERRVERRHLVLGERVGEANAMVCNERHVALSCNDASIHLWDFDVY